MPIYDYICTEGHVSELRRGYDEDILECPVCGHLAVRSPINESQSIITDTGAKVSRRADVPSDEVYLKPRFDLYREAAQELEYKYRNLPQEFNPPLAKQGIARAKELARKGVTAAEFRKQRTS